jgi:type II secretory pathway pseudopilin PulG
MRRSASEAGFTLLELLVAVMFLSVGILGIAQVFAAADRHTASSRQETTATSLAEEIREKIMSEAFDHVYSIFNGVDTSVPSTISLPASDWAQHLQERLGPDGRGTIQVGRHEEDPTIGPGLVVVTVTEYWTERGHQISLPVQFAIANTGP